MVEALGWAAFLAGLVGTLVLQSEQGFGKGLRSAWFVATLAIPGWFAVSFRSIGLDAMTGVAVATFVVFLFRPFRGEGARWVAGDLLIALIVLMAVVSEALNRVLIPGTVFELVRTWIFPYMLGRLAYEAWPRMRESLPLIVLLASALSAFAILEAFAKVNVLAMLSGKKWVLLELGEGFRWGLKRAQGVSNHPIYLGLLLCLTLPWILIAARQARNGEGPGWWRHAPVLVVLGAFLTIARSAHVAVAIVLVADLFFRNPRSRLPLMFLAAGGAIVFVVFREELLDLLGAYAGEGSVGEDTVRINGIERPYTGTRHRDLLMEAYEEQIANTGWFGYGTQMDPMPRDPNMDQRFRSIDNHYLLHHLRYGLVGTIVFISFAVSVALQLARLAWNRGTMYADLAAGMFGAFCAVAVVIRGVALSFDFGATWLFVAGLAGSMYQRLAPAPSPTSMMATSNGEVPQPRSGIGD